MAQAQATPSPRESAGAMAGPLLLSLPRLAAFVALLVEPVASEGIVSKLTEMVDKIYSPPKLDSTPCRGTSCCVESSCWKIPGMGCKLSRGDTTCEGASRFPPSKGVCRCTSGVCSSSGVCPGSTSTFSQLYSESEAPQEMVTPEDFTLPFVLLGVAGFALMAGGLSLSMRLSRGGSVRQALQPETLASRPDGAEQRDLADSELPAAE
mmetsp:Transcript_28392/g.61820  ORF Transcript_28392/g.61820 Transcript_28392/m.61820 type:complete len:208 (+) Transcript_28392:3-626(+)